MMYRHVWPCPSVCVCWNVAGMGSLPVLGDLLGSGGSAWLLAPSALLVAYGAARAGTTLCNEARNMVFAKVRCVWSLMRLRRCCGAFRAHAMEAVGIRSWRQRPQPSIHAHLAVQVTQGAIRRVSNQVFSHLHTLDLSFHLSRQTGERDRACMRVWCERDDVLLLDEVHSL
jgi:hypothetical protein